MSPIHKAFYILITFLMIFFLFSASSTIVNAEEGEEDPNNPPSWKDIPGSVVTVDHGKTFRYDVNATDPDDDELHYSIETDPEIDIKMNPYTGDMNWQADRKALPVGVDQVSVTISVTDGEAAIDHKFILKVNPPGKPVSKLISPTDGSRVGTSIILKWEGSDPESEPLVYDVYLCDVRDLVSSMSSQCRVCNSTPNTTFNASGLERGKVYYWIAIPYNGISYGTCSTWIWSIRINKPPTLNLSDAETLVGTAFAYKINVSDPDEGDESSMDFWIVNGPEGMTIDSKGNIEWDPKKDQSGDHVIQIKVSDGLDSATGSFDLVVTVQEGSKTQGSGPLLIIAGSVILVGLLVGIAVFVLIKFRTKEEVIEEVIPDQKPEEYYDPPVTEQVKTDVPITFEEAHKMDGKDRPKTYEELYGAKPPA